MISHEQAILVHSLGLFLHVRRAQPLLDGASDRLIPDVLLPGQTAGRLHRIDILRTPIEIISGCCFTVLQASARHECSGLCTDTSRFAAGISCCRVCIAAQKPSNANFLVVGSHLMWRTDVELRAVGDAGVIDGAAPIDASPVPAAPSAKRSKQDQILSLKHLHDLDEVLASYLFCPAHETIYGLLTSCRWLVVTISLGLDEPVGSKSLHFRFSHLMDSAPFMHFVSSSRVSQLSTHWHAHASVKRQMAICREVDLQALGASCHTASFCWDEVKSATFSCLGPSTLIC